MNWKDIIIGAVMLVFFVRFMIFVFKSKPSDKYHNDSWLENRAKMDIDQELWNKMKQNINYYL